jgi:predicted transcriptional regulator of viral defense system
MSAVPTDRRDLRRRLFRLAAEQGGYFTAAQARTLGYSYQAQAYHVGAGNWLRVDRGLFRLAEWLPEVHDDLARWTLWSKGRAIISHETALSVHGIGEFESPRVHLTVPPGFTMRDDAVVLHFAELPREDVDERPGFRTTTPVRTVIDIAAQSPDQDQLNRVIHDARHAGLLTLRTLRARAEVVDARAALYIERAISEMEPR